MKKVLTLLVSTMLVLGVTACVATDTPHHTPTTSGVTTPVVLPVNNFDGIDPSGQVVEF